MSCLLPFMMTLMCVITALVLQASWAVNANKELLAKLKALQLEELSSFTDNTEL